MNLSERKRKVIRRASFVGIGAAVCYFLVRSSIFLSFFGRVVLTDSASIGIIGGADGPTAIFITSTPNISGKTVAAILLLVSLCGVWFTRKKK